MVPVVIIHKHELEAFLGNRQANPHGWLGMHPITHKRQKGVVARAFVRAAVRCDLVDLDSPGAPSVPMARLTRSWQELAPAVRWRDFRGSSNPGSPHAP